MRRQSSGINGVVFITGEATPATKNKHVVFDFDCNSCTYISFLWGKPSMRENGLCHFEVEVLNKKKKKKSILSQGKCLHMCILLCDEGLLSVFQFFFFVTPTWSIRHRWITSFHFSFLMWQSVGLTQTDIHALSGTRTHDPSVPAGEDISCLRLPGRCDRTYSNRLPIRKQRLPLELYSGQWLVSLQRGKPLGCWKNRAICFILRKV
jgi:hypothetical protein